MSAHKVPPMFLSFLYRLRKHDVPVGAQEAISHWLDTAAEFGDPVPEPKGRRLMLA